MATGAYSHFSETRPDHTTDNGAAFAQYIRDQDQAARDAVLTGIVPGWAVAYTYDGSNRISTVTGSKGAERHKKTITYGTSGGAIGKPVTVVWQWSSDSGATWDTVATKTITWNASGYPTNTNTTAE